MLTGLSSSILNRFLAFVLSLAVLSVLAGAGALSLFYWTEFERTIEQDYRQIIKSTAGEIRSYIHESRNELASIANILSFAQPAPNDRAKEMMIAAFMDVNPKFINVALICVKEIRAISANPLNPEMDYRNSAPFKKALEGETGLSDVLHTKNALPFIQIAIPIKGLNPVVDEVLWAELNLKSVWDVLNGIRIGEKGRASVVSGTGEYISHLEVAPVLKKLDDRILRSLEKIRFTPEVVNWNDPVTAEYCTAAHIQDLDWYVLIGQPRTEIYGHFYNSFTRIAVVIIGICLISSFWGNRWVKRLLQPIRALHDQVKEIGKGNLDRPIVVTGKDEIGALAAEFNTMARSLQELIAMRIETTKELAHARHLAVLGEASSKMTHEVRNIINNINLFLGFLSQRPLDPVSKEMIPALKANMACAETFTNNFLQFARKPTVDLKLWPPDFIVEEALSGLREAARQQGVTLSTTWAENLPKVPMDIHRMTQVILNLVKNSLDAVAETGKAGKIQVHGFLENGHVCLQITDTGSGIPPEKQEKIFEPFFTTKQKTGTGLGLAIVWDIIKAHGGQIDCHCPAEGGTVFSIHLPLAFGDRG